MKGNTTEKRRNHSPRRSSSHASLQALTTPPKKETSLFRWRSTTGHPSAAEKGAEVNSLLLPCLGMFVFYVCHDALQEEMFRFEGFEFGWFMSLAEVFIMLIGAFLSEGVKLQYPPGGYKTWGATAIIGLCVAGSHGFGNTALRFSTYPLKVSFKSCKLVPTMAFGVCVTGRRHSVFEYVSALIMCAGLMGFTLADATTNSTLETTGHAESNAYIGPILLGISASLDSIVPNLQERIFTQTKARTVDTIFLANSFMLVILTVINVISGELFTAWDYCQEHVKVFAILTLQAASAYCGLRCYLTIIKDHGSIAGVLLANARKVVTIMLSFFLFAKPCTPMHLAGLTLIFIGVYLGLLAKQKNKIAKPPSKASKPTATKVSVAPASKGSVEIPPGSTSSILSSIQNMMGKDNVV